MGKDSIPGVNHATNYVKRSGKGKGAHEKGKGVKGGQAPKAKARTAKVKARGTKGTATPAESSGIPKAIAQPILGRRTL